MPTKFSPFLVLPPLPAAAALVCCRPPLPASRQLVWLCRMPAAPLHSRGLHRRISPQSCPVATRFPQRAEAQQIMPTPVGVCCSCLPDSTSHMRSTRSSPPPLAKQALWPSKPSAHVHYCIDSISVAPERPQECAVRQAPHAEGARSLRRRARQQSSRPLPSVVVMQPMIFSSSSSRKSNS